MFSEVLLCKNAPREWRNRAKLWNAVEKAEKSVNSQLARDYDLALPVELSRKEQIELLLHYVQKTFVNQGMCADIAIHDKDQGNPNPHAHVMLTMRPILSNGQWGAKTRKQYILDPNGQRQYDPAKRTYQSTVVKSTNWDSREFFEHSRAAWASAVNEKIVPLGIKPIDHRSYEAQGIDRLPTIHLGTTANDMEKKGIRTELGDANRRITARNRRVREIERELNGLVKEKERLGHIIDIEHNEKAQQSPGYAHWAKLHNLKVNADAMNFLSTKHIGSYEQLVKKEEAARKNTEDIKKQLKALDEKRAFNGSIQRNIIQYMQTRDVYRAYKDGGRRLKFRKAHSAEIEKHEAAREHMREAEQQLGHKLPLMKELKAERAQLEAERKKLKGSYQEAKSESKELTAARAAIESQLGIRRDNVQSENLDLLAELRACKDEAAAQEVELTKEMAPEKGVFGQNMQTQLPKDPER